MAAMSSRQPWTAPDFKRVPFSQIIKMTTACSDRSNRVVHGTAFHIGDGLFLTAAHNFHRNTRRRPRESKLIKHGSFRLFDYTSSKWSSETGFFNFTYQCDFIIPKQYFETTDPIKRRSYDFAIFKLPELLADRERTRIDAIKSAFRKKHIRTWKEPDSATITSWGEKAIPGVNMYACGFPAGNAQLFAAHLKRLLPPNSKNPEEDAKWGISYRAETLKGMSGGPLLVDFVSRDSHRPMTYIFGVHSGFISRRRRSLKVARAITDEIRSFIENGSVILRDRKLEKLPGELESIIDRSKKQRIPAAASSFEASDAVFDFDVLEEPLGLPLTEKPGKPGGPEVSAKPEWPEKNKGKK